MLLYISILFGFLIFMIFSILKWKIHPFIALLLTALGLGVSMELGGVETVNGLFKGFNETLRWIAVIIILGAFIGKVLQTTGGAFRIANKKNLIYFNQDSKIQRGLQIFFMKIDA